MSSKPQLVSSVIRTHADLMFSPTIFAWDQRFRLRAMHRLILVWLIDRLVPFQSFLRAQVKGEGS